MKKTLEKGLLWIRRYEFENVFFNLDYLNFRD